MDWLKLALFLSCTAAVLAQEELPVDPLPAEPELIRCKRPLCENVCSFDVKLDAHGCPTCECLEDPCKEVQCPAGQQCQPLPCLDNPCERLEHTCRRAMACPLRDCVKACPHGYKKDASGCETCECEASLCEDFECGPGMRCLTHRPCPPGEQCDFEPRCVPDDGHEVAPVPACPPAICFMECQFGFKRDADGCDTCACNESPCENHECPSHEVCESTTEDGCEEGEDCPIYAKCVPKPLCHHMREHPHIVRAMGLPTSSPDQHRTRCQPDSGEFEYMQCGSRDCWCVDDRGVEVPETRRPRPLTDAPSTCVRNRTHSVDVRFNMTHDHPAIHQHLTELREVTLIKVTEWLAIEKDYVTGMEVAVKAVDVVEVHFLVVRGVDDEVDLPTAVFHMHYEIHSQHALVNYQGRDFHPDPTSVRTCHNYEPMLPSGGGLRPKEDDDSWEKKGDDNDSWEKHNRASSSSESSSSQSKSGEKGDSWEKRHGRGRHGNKNWLTKCRAYLKKFSKAQIAGIVIGFIVCFITFIGLVCLCHKACMKGRRQKYDMKKANLAFTNDLYATMHKLGPEDDKMKLNQKDEEKPADASMA